MAFLGNYWEKKKKKLEVGWENLGDSLKFSILWVSSVDLNLVSTPSTLYNTHYFIFILFCIFFGGGQIKYFCLNGF